MPAEPAEGVANEKPWPISAAASSVAMAGLSMSLSMMRVPRWEWALHYRGMGSLVIFHTSSADCAVLMIDRMCDTRQDALLKAKRWWR